MNSANRIEAGALASDVRRRIEQAATVHKYRPVEPTDTALLEVHLGLATRCGAPDAPPDHARDGHDGEKRQGRDRQGDGQRAPEDRLAQEHVQGLL
jgi:hypothetical protein